MSEPIKEDGIEWWMEHTDQDVPVCPYCFGQNNEIDYVEVSGEMNCKKCGETYHVTCSIPQISYSTRKRE